MDGGAGSASGSEREREREGRAVVQLQGSVGVRGSVLVSRRSLLVSQHGGRRGVAVAFIAAPGGAEACGEEMSVGNKAAVPLTRQTDAALRSRARPPRAVGECANEHAKPMVKQPARLLPIPFAVAPCHRQH